MAAPITHIYFAEQYLQKNPTENSRHFFVGTSFPDIRYLGVIERQVSHQEITELDQVESRSDFESGRRLHCWIDFVRAKFMQENKVYDYCPKSKWITQALKFYEDEVCYEEVLDWSLPIEGLDDVLDEELEYDIQKQDVSRWHEALCEYFNTAPSNQSRRKLITRIGMDDEVADEINMLIARTKKHKVVLDIVDRCIKEIGTKIKL